MRREAGIRRSDQCSANPAEMWDETFMVFVTSLHAVG